MTEFFAVFNTCFPSCPWVWIQPAEEGKAHGEVQMEGSYRDIASAHRLELKHTATGNYRGVECFRSRGSRFGE